MTPAGATDLFGWDRLRHGGLLLDPPRLRIIHSSQPARPLTSHLEKELIAVLTNDRQWRLVFAGLDFDAWCQWDVDLWFEEGTLGPQVASLRTLLQPALWTPEKKDATPALLQAILDSRKGQAELPSV